MTLGERFFAVLVRVYPRPFRARYGNDLMAFFREDRRHPRYGTGPLRPVRFWAATLRDLARGAAAERGGISMQRSLRLAVTDWTQDVRIALRALIRVPVLTLTIVGSVGLGIGTTAAIFAIIDAALLRPLPYPDSGELVRILIDTPASRIPFSLLDYRALAAEQTTFTSVAAFADRPMTYSDGATAERLRGRQVTASYFDTLGLRPALGRNFKEAEARPGAQPSVIVSAPFWHQRLGAAPDIVGKTIKLDGVEHVIVGVLPPVTGPLETGQDYFTAAQWEPPRRRGPFMLAVIGRVPDARRGAAAAELREMIRRRFPVWGAGQQRATWVMVELKAFFARDFGRVASLALAAVALVWLIACVNASNLLMARVTSRRRELAVRSALGASRSRLVRGLLTESAVLAVAAAALGIGLAWLGVSLARTAAAPYIPRAQEIVLGGRTLFVLGSVTIFSGLLFGMIPAMHGAGGTIEHGLRSTARSSTGSRAVQRLRGILVGAQFAVATPLLVVAGLLLASLNNLVRVDVGFETHNVLTGAVELPASQYPDAARILTFWERLRTGVSRLPGVTAVAFTTSRPPAEIDEENDFELEDVGDGLAAAQGVSGWVRVTPEYIGLLGLHPTEGRLWDATDTQPSSADTVVVDEAWARRYFHGRSAVGRRLKSGGCRACDWTTVIGVVPTVKYEGLAVPDQGIVYELIAESGERLASLPTSRSRYLIVRTSADAASLTPQVLRVLREIDPDVPLARVATIDDLVARSLEQPRALSLLVAALAIVALVLSVVGIYGVMMHHVQQQAKDISVRLALGGTPRRILQLVVRRGMTLVGWGLAAGVALASVLARLLSAQFFGVSPGDPVTFILVTALMLAAALITCGIPAARAIAVKPATALRND